MFQVLWPPPYGRGAHTLPRLTGTVVLVTHLVIKAYASFEKKMTQLSFIYYICFRILSFKIE